MILPIYTYGQPVLRKVAEDITPDYPELATLIENMFETMDHADGVGLAADQVPGTVVGDIALGFHRRQHALPHFLADVRAIIQNS